MEGAFNELERRLRELQTQLEQERAKPPSP
jgi:hypothetical protein